MIPRIVIEALYRLDKFANRSKSVLFVRQRYEFYQAINEDDYPKLACEPSNEPNTIPDIFGTFTCARWKPIYSYTFESTLDSATCRRCGRTIIEIHGTDTSRLLRHLPMLGRPVYLCIHPKRFRCPFCDDHPTTTQQRDWYDAQALHTKAYERQLIVQLVGSTISAVRAKEDVSYDALLGLLDRWIASSGDGNTLEVFSTLGIDEIALTKGHRNFVAVLSGRTAEGHTHLLAVLPDRLKTTVVAFLMSIPATHQRQITTLCSAMWEGYISAVQEVLPHGTLVIGRFHVACHYRSAVDALRKQEIRRLRQELPASEHDDLKRTRWPVHKQAAELTSEEQARPATLLTHSPALKRTYTLREEQTVIFDTARSKADGLRRLEFWRQRVERSGLTRFGGVLKLLERWQDVIANSFTDHQTSGFVECLNNKLKVLKRRCYGLRTIGRLFQRLTLDLDGYWRFSPWSGATH